MPETTPPHTDPELHRAIVDLAAIVNKLSSTVDRLVRIIDGEDTSDDNSLRKRLKQAEQEIERMRPIVNNIKYIAAILIPAILLLVFNSFVGKGP